MLRFDHESTFQAAMRTFWEWLLTERQVIVRSKGRIRFVPLSRIIQAGLACVVFVSGGWFVYSTVSYFDLRDTVFTQETVIARSERAYGTLVQEMANSRERFSSLVRLLGNSHEEVLDLVDRSAVLKTRLEKSRDGKARKGRGSRAAVPDEDIGQTLSRLEGKAATVEDSNKKMEQSLKTPGEKPAPAAEKQSRRSGKVDRLDVRVVKLAQRLATVRQSQNKLLNRVAQATLNNIVSAESVITLAGLDPKTLLRRIGASKHGQGGPFVPISTNDLRTESFQSGLQALNRRMEHWQDLQKVLRQLPLAAPMRNYWVSGKFGRRRDPFNRRWANHRGIDLASSWHAPIYAPAPGRVRIAGRWGRYGRFVEIDHGMGIRTRYGHLYKITVKRGQSVDFRQKLGEQGSTGRAKSAHLHYEILVNGRQVNPIKFLKAGEHVFKGQS